MFNPTITHDDPLEILRQLGGFYACPLDAQGKRLGPLVGYAGKDADGKNYVGEIYANFAVIEEYPDILDLFVEGIFKQVQIMQSLTDSKMHFDAVCGMPMGGLAIALAFARRTQTRYLFAEKQVLEAASEGKRERSKLIFNRHAPRKGDRVLIGEDVTNNFSTTGEAIDLVEACGAKVVGVISFLNRSLTVQGVYIHNMQTIPINSLVEKPIPQFAQSDPEVLADVSAGNVVWKPKDHWDQLMAAMTTNKK